MKSGYSRSVLQRVSRRLHPFQTKKKNLHDYTRIQSKRQLQKTQLLRHKTRQPVFITTTVTTTLFEPR